MVIISFVFVLQACERQDQPKPTDQSSTHTSVTTAGEQPILEFKDTEYVVGVGDELILNPITNLEGDDLITYTIADETVIAHDKDHTFTAVKEGVTTITVKLTQYPDVFVTLTVEVKKMININYQLFGGRFSERVQTRIPVDDLPLELPEPTQYNRWFVGWYKDEDYTGNYITTLPEDLDQDITLYARWMNYDQYSIFYYNLHDGKNSPNNPNVYTIHDLPIKLEEPTRPGYTFKGWYTDKNYRHGPIHEITLGKNYSLYALWESHEPQDQILVDSSLTDKEWGDTVHFQGIDYVFGINAFSSLYDGLSVAKDKVYIIGEFQEDVYIRNSNITLLGPNAGINPNTEERVQEAVIKGRITINKYIDNITFDGLAFTERGKVVASNSRNVTFINNIVFNTQEPRREWQALPGYNEGFLQFTSLENSGLVNLTIKNNRFENVHDTNITFTRVTNVHVEGNTFKNFKRDAIRFDNGGYNTGELTFMNNVFENDELSGYNGIYFAVYGGDEYIPTNIKIENNVFKNIGDPEIKAFSGAISMRNYQEKNTNIVIEYNTFEGCSNFIHIRNNATRENHKAYPWQARINNNVFKGIPTNYYYQNWIDHDDESTNPIVVDFQYNYFEDNAGNPITDLSIILEKIKQVKTYANHYGSYEEYQTMLESITPDKLIIRNPIDVLYYGENHLLDINIMPSLLEDLELLFTSSDPQVVEVSEDGVLVAQGYGEATITVSIADHPNVKREFTVYVPDPIGLYIAVDGKTVLSLGEELLLIARTRDNEDYSYTWTSSDETVATVDENGKVTTHKTGDVTITVTIDGRPDTFSVKLLVYDRESTSEVMQYFIDHSRGFLDYHSIYYIGSDDGTRDYLNTFYLSVNNYLFEEIEIIRNMLPWDKANHSKRYLPSLEFITVHDTANTAAYSGAKGNSEWVTSPNNTSTSWHYTVGNDGIYQQLEDDIVGWHAGDGSRRFNLIDTGVKATKDKPEISISRRGFYTFDGVESKILAPSVSQITEYGIYATVGENGNYWMNETWYNDTYDMIVNKGGNYNSIGIEMAVNDGSDVYFTWQRTAKLVASLMHKHGLGTDRLMFHNSFSGKPCPRTMITAGLEDAFFTLVHAEYDFMARFLDYEVTFESHNPDILGDNGRIIHPPKEATTVSYTITITKGEVSESITLHAVVLGSL